jgi:hypothetical protein
MNGITRRCACGPLRGPQVNASALGESITNPNWVRRRRMANHEARLAPELRHRTET